MKGQFRRQRTWSDIVRPAKGRQEVIKRRLVRHIHASHLETPLEAIAIEEVVVSNRSVKEIPLPNAGRVMVVIASAA
jgi:hypothetical protein